MSLNDGFSETFIFHIKTDMFKVVLNFTKGMYTVYASNDKILLRKKKVSQIELNRIKKRINDFITDDGKLRGFTPSFFKGFVI